MLSKIFMQYSDISPQISDFLLGKSVDQSCHFSLAGCAGSQRMYYRLKQNMVTYILMVSPSHDKDFAKFLRLTQFYRLLEFPVPKVYCIDDNKKQVLLEDLGDTRLYDAIQSNPELTQTLYTQAIDTLLYLQTRCYQHYLECPDISSRIFDMNDLSWETQYFKKEYLINYRKMNIPKKIDEALNKEFGHLAQLVESQPKTIMHRDYQSQNIMQDTVHIRVIDYQGSRLGSLYYDLASLLLDPYVVLSDENISCLFKYYHSKSLSHLTLNDAFEHFLLAGAQRIMQALGAYCFLFQTKKLSYFKQYIPSGEKRLNWILKKTKFGILQEIMVC